MEKAIHELEYEVFKNVESRNWAQRHLEIPVMISMLGLEKGLSILEIGCGRGVALGEFYHRLGPAKLAGLDNDGSLIHEAEENMERLNVAAELIHGDVREMPVESCAFDMVVDFGTLYHIARHQEGLAEIERVLKPGGVFVYETPLMQVFSHPIRSQSKLLDWRASPELRFDRFGWLWNARRKSR